MKTVDRNEYSRFVQALPSNVTWTPIETCNRAVMQITLAGRLIAQAHYPPGCTMKNGVIEGVTYQIDTAYQ